MNVRYWISVIVALCLLTGNTGLHADETKDSGNGVLHGQSLLEVYDGKCEAPVPLEELASLFDKAIDGANGDVTLTLVRHPEPSTQPANARAAWVCLVGKKPRWVVSGGVTKSNEKNSGVTSRVLKQARAFLAEHQTSSGKEGAKVRREDWQPAAETLLPVYQAKNFGRHITEIKRFASKDSRWAITFEPVSDEIGGEIWLTIQDGLISASFGK